MERLQNLEQRVCELYDSKDPKRADWADWLYANHVFIVADNATKLAKKYQANAELSRAGALLHDIADTKMRRHEPGHEEASLKMARELMVAAGYNEDEITLVVDDAIRYHSCHGDDRPASVEGKILSTADSLAHLQTDFYIYVAWALGREKPLEFAKNKVLEKIERDLNVKIAFEDEREAARHDYGMIKELFSR